MKRFVKTTRAKGAIAAVLATVVSIAGVLFMPDGKTPAAVELAANHLIKDWEGLRTNAYWDAHGKVWTACIGETKGVRKGMSFTKKECLVWFNRRLYEDFYIPIKKCVKGFETAPIGVQAAVLSFSWNLGVGTTCKTASGTRLLRRAILEKSDSLYEQACYRYTAYNRAGGVRLPGLKMRREYGDKSRIGEYEMCVAGLR